MPFGDPSFNKAPTPAAPPKSILKNPTSQQVSKEVRVDHTPELPSHLRDAAASLPDHLKSSNPQHLATALHHATQIQLKKELDSLILTNLETLLDYPTTQRPSTDPSEHDVQQVKHLLSPFQPSDYDSLIEERNINNQCGYCLCPSPYNPSTQKSGWRLHGGNGPARDFRIVPAKDEGGWCSHACQKMALYIKVQLSEMPSWERAGSGQQLELYGEREARTAEETRREQLSEEFGKMELAPRWMEELAGETGQGAESSRGLAERLGLVKEEVVERGEIREARPPVREEEAVDGMKGLSLIEGYATRIGRQS